MLSSSYISPANITSRYESTRGSTRGTTWENIILHHQSRPENIPSSISRLHQHAAINTRNRLSKCILAQLDSPGLHFGTAAAGAFGNSGLVPAWYVPWWQVEYYIALAFNSLKGLTVWRFDLEFLCMGRINCSSFKWLKMEPYLSPTSLYTCSSSPPTNLHNYWQVPLP